MQKPQAVVQKMQSLRYFCQYFIIKATPHKDRLTALRTPCLHLFRHLAQISIDRRGLPLRGEVSRSDRGADRQTSLPALNLHNLTENLTSQSSRNLCAVLPKITEYIDKQDKRAYNYRMYY